MSFAYRRCSMLSRRQPFPRYVRPLFHQLIESLSWHLRFSVSGPLGLTPYIPPSAGKPPAMIKVTGCEGTFAALSTKGDVWTFSAPSRLSTAAESGKDGKNKDRIIVKPQRIWTAKRLVDSARVCFANTSLRKCQA